MEEKIIESGVEAIETAADIPNQVTEVIDSIENVEPSGLNFKVIGGIALGTLVAAVAGIKIKKLIKKHKEKTDEIEYEDDTIFDEYSDKEILDAAEIIKQVEGADDEVEEESSKEKPEK